MLEFLNVLLNDYGCNDSNSLLTDRTFLVKAVKILKAKAVLEGRDRCVPEDLHVLKYLTAFRIPEELHNRIEEIIDQLLRKKKVEPEDDDDSVEAVERGAVRGAFGGAAAHRLHGAGNQHRSPQAGTRTRRHGAAVAQPQRR